MGSRIRAGEHLVLLNTFFMLVVMPRRGNIITQTNLSKKKKQIKNVKSEFEILLLLDAVLPMSARDLHREVFSIREIEYTVQHIHSALLCYQYLPFTHNMNCTYYYPVLFSSLVAQ